MSATVHWNKLQFSDVRNGDSALLQLVLDPSQECLPLETLLNLNLDPPLPDDRALDLLEPAMAVVAEIETGLLLGIPAREISPSWVGLA